ncbi:hypothetical protein PDIDSM_5964 [Penicillium digitatum]|nr:hypothetical protein PDIDSM_5964 [Penicillium digitatum]
MSDRTKKMETQIQLAVKAFSQANKPNIAQLAREFDVPYHRLRARIHGRQSYTDRATITRSLNSIQEKALTSWVQSLDSAYTSPTAEMVEGAANAILKKADEDRVEKSRVDSEDYGALLLWFNNLTQVMKHHQFLPHEIFNWDQTGYRIGKGKARKVITSRTTSYIATGGQSESITGIECISADGWLMLPWFLPKGNTHMEEWYENITTTDFRIKPTTNGWIDDETALQWLFSFHEATINEESSDGSSSTRQIAPFSCHVPTSLQPCPLADFYKLVVLCENQQQLGKIRLRICYVAFFRLNNAVQPGSQYQYDDASMFIAHLIRDSGCEDSLSDIERRVRHWVGLGERYSLLANDLGGLGVLYLLPQDGGESIWTKELPRSAKMARRIAMLNHLRQKGLPEEAQTRGLHALAEDEAAKVLGPIKASLERVMESQLSEANAHIVDESRQSNRTWPQLDIPQIRQPSAGTPCSQSGSPVATQVASTVGSPCNAMFSGQATSEMVQDVSNLHCEPSLTQISLQNWPDIVMSQVHTHGLELVYMPTKSGSCETLISHKQYSDPMSATSNQIAMITPADFPQTFAATSTSITADYPQIFPYQQRTVTPADYPLMFPCDPSQYLS